MIFGCWTSASRKSVKPVVEERSHLLIYPMAYEGLEQSPNIVYTGAAPNQQVIPAVSWCYETLKARKFFLVGSDYVWPHCVNEIIKDQLRALGAECAGESYVSFGSAEVGDALDAITKAKPDVIISTVVGDSNEPFYRRLKAAGILPSALPSCPSASRRTSSANSLFRTWSETTRPGITFSRSIGLRITNSSGGSRSFYGPTA